MTEERLLELCREAGAADARIIATADIPFDKSLRAYCEANTCGNYGRNYGCPPHIGEPDELIARAQTYAKALVFQTVGQLEDSFDVEGIAEAGKAHQDVCRRVFEEAVPALKRSLPMANGGCPLCKPCALLEGKPCRMPDKAWASVSSYCIHVSRMCGKCGMKYINGTNTVTFFGILLFDGE